METNEKGPFSNLSPAEIKILKAQVGAALNYTRQGSWPEALGDELRRKLTVEQIEYVKSQLDLIKGKKG